MRYLTNTQLVSVKERIDSMIDIIDKYEVKSTTGFYDYLCVISRNADVCISNDFDGLGELSEYIHEDWGYACHGRRGIDAWYIDIPNVKDKIAANISFQSKALSVDRTLATGYLFPKEWISVSKITNMGKINQNNFAWDNSMEKLGKLGCIYKSPVEGIPDDVWSYSKSLGIAYPDEKLAEWFTKDIPTFGYISPLDITTLPYGMSALKVFLQEIKIM